MAVAWLVQLLDGGWREPDGAPFGLWSRIRRTPLVLPTLILVGAYLISTALSIVLGSASSLVCALARDLHVSLLRRHLLHGSQPPTDARPGQPRPSCVILASLPISIYGWIQHTQVAPGVSIDPLPWGGDVTERVAANMGNSIFVAAYLIMHCS